VCTPAAGYEAPVLRSGAAAFRRRAVDIVALELSSAFWTKAGLDRKADVLPAFVEVLAAGYEARSFVTAAGSEGGNSGGDAAAKPLIETALDVRGLTEMVVDGEFQSATLVFSLPGRR
jgi:hypothetical protein